MENPDRQLLDRFVAQRDESAFRALVQRHLPMVHGVAKRITASEDLAADVAQQAFVRLAERAVTIPPGISLEAWLHRVTRHLAIDLVRSEERRKAREHRSGEGLRAMRNATLHPMMTTGHDESFPDATWAALAPVLDELVDALPAADREVLLARYYRDESHAQVARRLGLTDALTRKRASRALEKLRALLRKKGVATTSAALAVLLPAHAAPQPPAALLGSVTAAARGIAPVIPQGMQAFFLTMNATRKTCLAVMAVLMLGSLGYAIRPAATPFTVAVADNGFTAPDRTGAEGRIAHRDRRPPDYPDTAASRQQRLREIMLQRDPLQRQREMIAFLDQTPPGLFPEILDHLKGIDSGGMLMDEYRMLLSAWTAVDPAGATQASLDLKPTFNPGTTVYTWGAKDPAAALAGCAEHQPDWRHLALAGMATVDLPGALRLIHEQPQDTWNADMYWLFTSMYLRQPDALGRLLAELPPEERAPLMERGGQWVASSSPGDALDLINRYPGIGGKLDTGSMYRTLAVAEPEAAMKRVAEMAPAGSRGPAAQALATLGTMDLGSTLTMVSRYPQLAGDDESMAQILGAARPQDRELAMSRLEQLGNEQARITGWTTLLQHWRQGPDGEAADQWIASHAAELPEAVRATVTQPLEPAADHGLPTMQKK